ncbi:MAG: alanine--tRNA ligase [Candidatus Ancillula trichonymphae]|jgi:alanyl-tRNA synthetase|nr:alanine--tRNA ligase [Candidatus Ancillula trichonymphae]
MKTAEIKKRWLDFFVKRGHIACASSSLISPDPTTLFTIAGMVPFIPYMTGAQTPEHSRITTVQKCVRTADIDSVGRTTRHGTFFQMNGNFSFGDYFKNEAIEFAWDLVTGSVESGAYGMDKDKIGVTVWENDDEAYNRWLEVGLPKEHLQKLGKEENFWSTGGPGPAGPCSEIFLDRGDDYGADTGPANNEDRYLEIWNLVFMQWQIDSVKSKYDFNIIGDLKRKNIDTGMGLERVAYLLQGKNNIYEIDEVYPVIQKVEELTGLEYGSKHSDDVQMRIIADHIRSGLMIIADGVTPLNEGRGYVLRRLLRRAVRSLKLLGAPDKQFEALFRTSQVAMAPSYPELETELDRILEVVLKEEEVFSRTLKSGSAYLSSIITPKTTVISGQDAFKLHDTHGFPIELTLEIAADSGVKVDENAFRKLMHEQKNRAREDALKKRGAAVDKSVYSKLAQELASSWKVNPQEVVGNNAGISKFLGYETLENDARVVGIITEDGPQQFVKHVTGSEPLEVEVILDKTPFYAQSGGQVSDLGTIVMSGGGILEVDDVQKVVPELSVHKARLISGTLALDETGLAKVEVKWRDAVRSAHTATHIVHKALQEMVGKSATQSGSENRPGRLRLDFKTTGSLGHEIVQQIEERANQKVRENTAVDAEYMNIKQAQKIGAMALFGEKYGDRVRVVSLGRTDGDENENSKNGDQNDAWSIELCGGTHVDRTGDIGLVSVLGVHSIGTGIHRIQALVADAAYDEQVREHALISNISALLGATSIDDVPEKIQSLMNQVKTFEKKIENQALSALCAQIPALLEQAQTVSGRKGEVVLIAKLLKGVPSADILRSVAQDVKAQLKNGQVNSSVVLLVGVNSSADSNMSVVVAVDDYAQELGLNAGQLVRSVSQVLGGGGGGKPDFATGGGKDAGKVSDAIEVVRKQVIVGLE